VILRTLTTTLTEEEIPTQIIQITEETTLIIQQEIPTVILITLEEINLRVHKTVHILQHEEITTAVLQPEATTLVHLTQLEATPLLALHPDHTALAHQVAAKEECLAAVAEAAEDLLAAEEDNLHLL
jgi:hypothetical protein